jgi:hypothetical protein
MSWDCVWKNTAKLINIRLVSSCRVEEIDLHHLLQSLINFLLT